MNQSVNELCIRCAFFDVKEGCALDRHWKRGKDGKITCYDFMPPEAITLPADTPRGHVLLTYQQLPLGFVKNLGNRANNLYPNEWRIKTTHIPEELGVRN